MELRRWHVAGTVLTLTGGLLLLAAGCGSALLTAAYLWQGTDDPAEYPGLKGKTVAVICRPPGQLQFRNPTAAKQLAEQLALLLKKEVPKIKVIDQRKVDDWADSNAWNDYADVGKALKADMVVGIELSEFSTYEGPTLYQGRATASVKVLDLNDNNNCVFSKDLNQFLYPPHAPIPIAEKSEPDFRREFTANLAHYIGRLFFAYDRYQDSAVDARAGL